MSEAIASKEARLAAYNANIAAADKDPQLSPETGKPLSKVNTIRFGAGFLLFGVLWMSGLGIVSAVLLPMHYKTIEVLIRTLSLASSMRSPQWHLWLPI